ncbi:MAG TPA: Rha family transcriptional regulator [Methylotenera sp.]
MTTLVENKLGEAFADSALIARKFGMKHNKLISVVDSVFNDYPDLRGSSDTPQSAEKYFTEERIYHGQAYTAYMMNRAFFSLVAMRFTTKPAREWQRKFNTAFYQLENQLLLAKSHQHDQKWLAQRTQTKLLRRAETEVIEQFVDYATVQGSQNAKNYYSLITTATYRALGLIQHKQPHLRNTLNALQLSWLVTLESLVQASLRKYMSLNVHYKEIYKLVVNDIRQYAAPLTLLEH